MRRAENQVEGAWMSQRHLVGWRVHHVKVSCLHPVQAQGNTVQTLCEIGNNQDGVIC